MEFGDGVGGCWEVTVCLKSSEQPGTLQHFKANEEGGTAKNIEETV